MQTPHNVIFAFFTVYRGEAREDSSAPIPWDVSIDSGWGGTLHGRLSKRL